MTLKFDGWPRKTIGQLFLTTSSFVHNFKAIGEFWSYSPVTLNSGKIVDVFVPGDIEIWRMTFKNTRVPPLCYFTLQSGNAQLGSKSGIFCPLKFDKLPWKQWGTSPMPHQALCIIPSPCVNSNWSHSPEMANSCQNQGTKFFVPCNLEIWQMTLKTNRAPFLCYLNLCALFRSRLWIQTGDTARKSPNWGKTCFDHCDLHLWPLTPTFGVDITFVNGNNWKFHDIYCSHSK